MLATAMQLAAAAVLSLAPPSGHPPTGPMQRYEPRVYDLRVDCVLDPDYLTRTGHVPYQSLNLDGRTIAMSAIVNSTFSELDPTSIKGEVWYSSTVANQIGGPVKLVEGGLFNSQLIEIHVEKHHARDMRWRMAFRTRTYSAKIDDAAAAQLKWPDKWPDDVQEALKPQQFIESNDPIFASAVQTVTNGNLRNVPPYLAVKELVRYCLLNFHVSDSGNRRQEDKTLIGMALSGAAKAAHEGKGTPHDLACICVATLRAAEIPARVVVGLEQIGVYEEYVSWCEFYLVGAGWIPFDPDQMRGKGENRWKATDPWPEFGSMKDLNHRIPLAFSFTPKGFQGPGHPGAWGWSSVNEPSDLQVLPSITFTTTSRGEG